MSIKSSKYPTLETMRKSTKKYLGGGMLLGEFRITNRNILDDGDGAQFHNNYIVDTGDYIIAFIQFYTDFDDGTENTESYVIRIDKNTNTISFTDYTYFNRYRTDYVLYLYENKLYFNMKEEASGDRIHGRYDIINDVFSVDDGIWNTGTQQDNTPVLYNNKELTAGYYRTQITGDYDAYIPFLVLNDPV